MSGHSLVQRLVETDHRGRILYATPEVAVLIRTPARELVGLDFFQLFPDEGRALRLMLRAAILDQTPPPMTAALTTVQGRTAGPVRITVVRLDARKVQWRLVPLDGG